MSELIKWFAKRRETKALTIVQRHLALTTGIVEDLEKAIRAAIQEDVPEMLRCIERVVGSEREADTLRRKVMDEILTGELAPTDREDLMDLVKRVDMVADWSRESTRILGAIPMQHVPESLKNQSIEMVLGARQCVVSLQKCVNRIMTNPEEALQTTDAVEREEADSIHEKARILFGKENLPRAGVAVLVAQLVEAVEMIADSCEDACDQVRIVIKRK